MVESSIPRLFWDQALTQTFSYRLDGLPLGIKEYMRPFGFYSHFSSQSLSSPFGCPLHLFRCSWHPQQCTAHPLAALRCLYRRIKCLQARSLQAFSKIAHVPKISRSPKMQTLFGSLTFSAGAFPIMILDKETCHDRSCTGHIAAVHIVTGLTFSKGINSY